MLAAAGRPITVFSPGSEFFGPISELRRELALNIGVSPEDDLWPDQENEGIERGR